MKIGSFGMKYESLSLSLDSIAKKSNRTEAYRPGIVQCLLLGHLVSLDATARGEKTGLFDRHERPG